MEELNKKMDSMFKKLEKLDELKDSVKFLSAKYDEIKNNLNSIITNQDTLNHQLTKISKINKEHKVEIDDLKDRVEYLERRSLESSFNLFPVIKINGENLKDMVKLIGERINRSLDEKNIIDVYRRPDRKNGKPGEIVVKCISQDIRDKVIAEVKKKGITHSDFGIACQYNKIFANEELTNKGKDIYYKALKLKYEKKWKYVWIKYGRIYAKEKDGSKAIRLDSLEMLDTLL